MAVTSASVVTQTPVGGHYLITLNIAFGTDYTAGGMNLQTLLANTDALVNNVDHVLSSGFCASASSNLKLCVCPYFPATGDVALYIGSTLEDFGTADATGYNAYVVILAH